MFASVRQLMIEVARGQGQRALEIAGRHCAVNSVRVEAAGLHNARDLVFASVSNSRVETLLDDLEELTDLHVTFAPHGVLALRPPAEQTAEQAMDVAARSPVEVYLSGLQSVGSWKGFLAYAAAAGAVVWIGLFTNTVFLLTAAMLIAPFAGPAMNAALATARGDASLFGRSLLRYTVGLLVSIAVALLFSVLLRQEVATELMVSASQQSSTAVFLPLVAGAAGALNLCQSERSSLVSGAATGMLVAASLAPPAGVVGIATVLRDWDMVESGAFVLLLQVLGINLAGAIVFRLHGISARGARYARGKRGVSVAVAAGTVAVLVGLLVLQFSEPPHLQRSTRSSRAKAEVAKIVRASGLARLVDANVRFTRADIPKQDSLLTLVYVQSNGSESHERVRESLTKSIGEQLASDFDVTPLVHVTVLEPADR